MTKTPSLNLNVPDYQDERWDIPVNENWNLLDTAIAGKQATLTFDTTPTSGSTNPVTSDGLYLALLGKANDSDVVKLTGDQTVAGTKTFSGNTIHSMDVIRKSSTITRGTAPSSVQYTSWLIRDKNNAQIGNFYVTQTTNNEIQASMIATNLNSSDAAYDAAIRVVAKRDGTVYTYAPTPATADNSTKIATTAFVKNNFQVVTALPANPVAGVFYFVKE